MSAFGFELPSLPEQRRITTILGALDEKIALNRRMNRTLEGMARALFKEWFVDFGPVRAKAEVRRQHPTWSNEKISRVALPMMNEADSQCFPSEMCRAPEGELPAEWRFGGVGQIANEVRQGICPSDIPQDTPYIALEHMPKRCIALDSWQVTHDIESGKSQFRMNDILFGKLRPYFHRVGIAPVDGVCSTDIVVIRPIADIWHTFTAIITSSDDFIEYTSRISGGTKMPRTSWKDMANYQMVIPTSTIATVFKKSVQPMIAKMQLNVAENHVLARLRDKLLPKLISGELRIKDAERLVGKAV